MKIFVALVTSLALATVSNAIDCRVCTPGIPVANQCATPNDWRVENDCAACGTLNFQFRDDDNDYRVGNGQWVQLNDYSCITPTMLAFVSPVVIDKLGLRSAVQQQQQQNGGGGFSSNQPANRQFPPGRNSQNGFRPQITGRNGGGYGPVSGGYGGGASSFYTQSNNNNNFGTQNELPYSANPRFGNNYNNNNNNNLYGQQQQQQQQGQRYQNTSRFTFVTANQPPFGRYESYNNNNNFDNSRPGNVPGLYDRNTPQQYNNNPQQQSQYGGGSGGGSANSGDYFYDAQQQNNFNGGGGAAPSRQQTFGNNLPQQQQQFGNQRQQLGQPLSPQQQFQGNNPSRQPFSRFGSNANSNGDDPVCTDNADLIKQFQVDAVNGLEHQLYEQEQQPDLAYLTDEYRAGLFQTFTFPELFRNTQMCVCFGDRCTDRFQPGQALPVNQYNSGERQFQQQNGQNAGENAYLLREPQYQQQQQQNNLGGSNNNGQQNSQLNFPSRRLARQPPAQRLLPPPVGQAESKTPPARFADEEVHKAPVASSNSTVSNAKAMNTNKTIV